MPFAKKAAKARQAKAAAAAAALSYRERSTEQGRNLSNGPTGKPVPKSAVDHIKRPFTSINIDNLRQLVPSLESEHDTENKPLESESSPKKSKGVYNGHTSDETRDKPEQTDESTAAKPTVDEPTIADAEIPAPMLPSTTSSAQPEPRMCHECRTTKTSTWRRDMQNNLICNKCGLRKRKDHHAPSRRLIEKTPEKHVDTTAFSNEQYVSNQDEETSLPPIVDPRPPRPWVNHQDRVSTRPAQASHDPSNGSSAQSSVTYHDKSLDSAAPLHALKQSPEPQYASSPVARVPSRRRGPKKAMDQQVIEVKVCVSCKTQESPAWRRGADGSSLCNRCMLRQKRAEQKALGLPSKRVVKRMAERDEHLSIPQQAAQQHLFTFQTNPSYNNTPYRSESQIVLQQYTHLNSSFASDTAVPTFSQNQQQNQHQHQEYQRPREHLCEIVPTSTEDQTVQNHGTNTLPPPINHKINILNEDNIDPQLTDDHSSAVQNHAIDPNLGNDNNGQEHQTNDLGST